MRKKDREAENEPRALLIPEAARAIGITEKALRQRIWRGEIPIRRLGKRVLILKSELQEFLSSLPTA